MGVNQQTSSYSRINATLVSVAGEGHGKSTTSNDCLIVVVCSCSLIFGFVSFVVVFLVRAVLVDLHNLNDREPDVTVQPCSRIPGLLEGVGGWGEEQAAIIMCGCDGGWYSGDASLSCRSVFAWIRAVNQGF